MKRTFLLLPVLLILFSACGQKEPFEIICKPKISVSDSSNFSYLITNNSEEQAEVSLGLTVSKYQNGEWIPLAFSEEFYEIHYNAFLWAEPLLPKCSRQQEFSMSLTEMLAEELVPGKYRLEKEIWSNKYYAEFEIF